MTVEQRTIERLGCRALLLFGDTETSATLRHEVPIPIIDPLLFVELDGRTIVLTSQLERARIAAVLPEAEILDYFAFGMKGLREDGLSHAKAEREVSARVARQLGIDQAIVPSGFPTGLADRLRADGVEVLGRRRRLRRPAALEERARARWHSDRAARGREGYDRRGGAARARRAAARRPLARRGRRAHRRAGTGRVASGMRRGGRPALRT